MSSDLVIDLKRMLQRRGNRVDLPILEDGELGLVQDEKKFYFGLEGKNYQILGDTDVADNLTTNNSDKVLSAKQGLILSSEINQIKNYYDGYFENIENFINEKQDKMVHEGSNPPSTMKMIWYKY